MAVQVGAIEIVLRTDLDQFVGGMRRAASEVDSQGQRITRATGDMASSVRSVERSFRSFDGGTAFRGLELSALRASNQVERLRSLMLLIPAALGGTSAALGVRQLTDLADEATKVRNRINTVVEGTGKRAAAEEQVFEIAQRTRQEYAATAQLFARTTQAAQGLGRSQSEVLQFVEAVQKANLISGSTTQEAAASATQLAQGLASNRLQGDELRSILENNVALTQILAQELAGGSVGRLREMGTEGSLTAQAVIDAVLRRQEEINRRFGQSSPLIAQGLTYLNNALIRYVGIIDQAAGGSERIGSFLRWIGDNVPGIVSALTGLGVALLALATMRFSRNTIGGLFGGMRAEIAASREAATVQRDAAAAALETARRNQAAALEQSQAASNAVRAAGAAPILASASPQAVQRLSEAEARLAKSRNDIAAADARIAALAAKRADIQREMGNVRPPEAFYRAAFNLSGAQAEVQRGSQLLESARQVRAQFEQEAARSAGQTGAIISNGMAAYARASATVEENVTRDNERRAAALRAAERTFAQQAGRMSEQEQRRLVSLARVDQQILAAQADRVQASTSGSFATAGVAQARQGIEQSASERLAALKAAETRANERLFAATAAVGQAQDQAAGAAQRLGDATSRLAGLKTGLLAVGSSLVNFLGGPWGVAFAVASAALGIFAYRQGQAAEEASRHKRALEGLPEAIRAVREAQLAAAAGRPQLQAELSARSSLRQIQSAQQADQTGALDDARRVLGGNRALFNALQDAGAVPDDQRLPSTGRLNTAQAAQMVNFLGRLRREGRLTEEQLDRVMNAVTDKGLSGGADPVGADALVKRLTAMRDRARQIEELSGRTTNLGIGNARAGAIQEDSMGAPNPALAARRAEMEKLQATMTALRASAEAAAPAFKTLAEEVMRPLTEGATGIDLARRTGISEQAKTAVADYIAALEQLRAIAGTIPDANLRSLVQSFIGGSIPVKEFAARLEELRNANPDMAGIIRGLTETASQADSGRSKIDALQRAINALTGNTINIIMRISQVVDGTPADQEADGLSRRPVSPQQTTRLNRYLQDNALQEALRRSRQSKEEYGIEDLRQQHPTATDAQLRELYRNNLPERSGRGDSAAKGFAKTIRELREEAASFTLNDVDRETVRYARTAKVAEADVRAFMDSMSEGRTGPIPARIAAIRRELQELNSLRLQKEFQDRYATDDERYKRELARLRDANFDPATFEEMRKRMARGIFGDPGGEMAKGFSEAMKSALTGDWEGAVSNLGKRFINIIFDALFKPFEKGLADLFRGLFDNILGGGAGGGGSGGLFGALTTAIGGIFGGGTAVPADLYHGGGAVGGASSGRMVSAAAWSSAPRYHSGLRTGEVRAILEQGERVLTQRDSNSMFRVYGGLAKAAQTPVMGGTKVNVVNNGPTRAETTTGPDGSIEVLIPALENRMASRIGRREGTLHTATSIASGGRGNGGLRG